MSKGRNVPPATAEGTWVSDTDAETTAEQLMRGWAAEYRAARDGGASTDEALWALHGRLERDYPSLDKYHRAVVLKYAELDYGRRQWLPTV